jgi:hypothetical protein
MKEASDPKLDGFLTAEEVIDLMMHGWGFKVEYGGGFDCNSYYITKTAGRVRSDTLSRLRSEGWITETGPNHYEVTDAGRRLFNHEKSTNLSKCNEQRVFEAGPVSTGAALNITIVADGAIRSITDNNGNIWVKRDIPLKAGNICRNCTTGYLFQSGQDLRCSNCGWVSLKDPSS